MIDKSIATITQRGRIFRFRINPVITVRYFSEALLLLAEINFRIPNAPPKPMSISIPVIGTSGSIGRSGCARLTEDNPKKSITTAENRMRRILFLNKFNGFKSRSNLYPRNVHSILSRIHIQRTLPTIFLKFLER